MQPIPSQGCAKSLTAMLKPISNAGSTEGYPNCAQQ